MRYLTLHNGVQIPIIGYGTAGLKGEQAYSCVKEALQLGYRMIDTAHMYGNEKEVGRAIKDSQIPRNKLFIVSKMDSRSNSYSKAKDQIEKSLSDLDLSYIDLYLIHEPYDESNEMWKALEEAYNNGILKSIGISNFFGKRFTEFIKNCQILPMVNQLETHIYLQRKQDQRILNEKGIVLMSWSPLTGGKADFYNDPILSEIGKKYNKTVAQIVLKYFTSRNVIVIPKTTKNVRMIENMNIFDFDLTDEEINDIESLDKNETLFPWTKEFETQ